MHVSWGANELRHRTAPSTWKDPIKWNSRHEAFFAAHGRRQRVFCASLADVFDNAVSVQWRYALLRLIMDTPNLDWLLLTKRIGNAEAMLEQAMRALTVGREGWRDNYLRNVWLGATIVNQEEADRDIPKLLATPARVRFLSMEPLLGPVDLRLPTRTWTNSAGFATCDHCCNGDRCDDPTHYERGSLDWRVRCPHCRGTGNGKPIDWVIVGGESGPGARPMHPDWARSLRDQCAAAGVPFLFKQWGEWRPEDWGERAGYRDTAGVLPSGEFRLMSEGYSPPFDEQERLASANYVRLDGCTLMDRVGKKAAGRELDGRTHDQFPRGAA
jgi:protein gp37